MKDDTFLYQHKDMKKTHALTVENLEELRKNAIDESLDPCYIVEYHGRKWFMVDENCFDLLKRALNYGAY